MSKDYVGPVGDPISLNIMECNKVIGNAPAEYGVLATWHENMRHWLLGFN